MAIDDFDKYLGNLKTYLPDVEDASFSWADVIGLLVIKLRNTDSLNKARTASHATQIQLTSESGASEGKRKTEDFFPTLTLNSSFKSWRIAIPTRIHRDNILQLDSNDKGITEKWIDDSIQIRRRILNEDEQGNGNPALQICYGNDLMPLRELLNVDDYIVVVNADKIKVTGKKMDQKVYYHHSDYVGGMKEQTLKEKMAKKPEDVIYLAVKGMLPKGPLGRQMIKKLYVYAGPEHKQQAQKPEVLEIKY